MTEDISTTSLASSKDKSDFFNKNKKSILKSAPNHMYLLVDPEGYAKGAIEELERQLLTVKSSSRKNKIENKINQWKLSLKVLSESDTEQDQNNNE